MTHRHKGLTMEVEKHKNNDVSTMRMSQEENNITINVTLQTTNPKRHNVMVRKLYNSITGICISHIASINLTKVRPLFTLLHRGSENSPLMLVFSANYIDQSNVTFMRMKVGLTISSS